jgi:hypothetical protein
MNVPRSRAGEYFTPPPASIARSAPARVPALVVIALLLRACSVQAGPNAGGTIVAHDVHLFLSATNGSVTVCEQGDDPTSCAGVDARIDGASAAEPAVFRVYAAFPIGSSPRLLGVAWGIRYNTSLALGTDGAFGNCGDLEFNQPGWPATDTGSQVVWSQAQTALLVPMYWFAAYPGAPTILSLTPHPAIGGDFGDDSVLPVLDAIAGYGQLGFDTDGAVVCPPGNPGACCDPPTQTCTVIPAPECDRQGGIWLGPGSDCQPNPCPQLFGACCALDGSCTLTDGNNCFPPSTWHGGGTTCEPNPCPQAGACCYPDGDCLFEIPSFCSGTFLGIGVPCTPNPCPATPSERESWGRLKDRFGSRR